MQRFRRSRSESKKRKEHDRASSSRASSTISRTASSSSHTSRDDDAATAASLGAQNSSGMSRSASNSSSLLLPEPEDFRTSLILPHLTARFEVLRGTDGQLVDFETLTSHLDEQRKTGRLTTFEMDAVLQQYKLQSAFEANQHPLPTSKGNASPLKIKKKRIDWSGVDLEKFAAEGGGSGGNRSVPAVSISTSPTRQQMNRSSTSFLSPNALTGSPTSSRNSFVSFAPSPEVSQVPLFPASVSSPPLDPIASTSSSSSSSSVSSSPNPNPNPSSPTSSPQYMPRRGAGGGTLFGGRIAPGSAGMVKSRSQNSIASVGSSASRSRRGLRRASDEETRNESDRLDAKGKGKEQDDHDDVNPSDRNTRGTLSNEQPPNLTSSQIKRISTALDSLQDELSKTFITTLRGASRVEAQQSGIDEVNYENEDEDEDQDEIDSRFRDPEENDDEQVEESSDPLTPSLASRVSNFVMDLGSSISSVDQDDFEGVGTLETDAGGGRAPSRSVSDAEPTDSIYSRAAPAALSNPSNSRLEQAAQVPLPPSSSISSSIRSLALSDALQPRSASPPTPIATVPPLSTSDGRAAGEEAEDQNQRQRQYTSETDTTETPSTPNGTTMFPRAYSFPFVPNRDVGVKQPEATQEAEEDANESREYGSERSVEGGDSIVRGTSEDETESSREGSVQEEDANEDDDADLTLLASSIPLPDESIVSEEEEGDAARPPSRQRDAEQQRDSLFSVASSTGSSFHEALESVGSAPADDFDDEIHLPAESVNIRESKLLDELPPPLPRSKPSGALASSVGPSHSLSSFVLSSSSSFDKLSNREEIEADSASPFAHLDRLPSEELLAIAAGGPRAAASGEAAVVGTGTEELALRDLVVIQEALVKRAEGKQKRDMMNVDDVRPQDEGVTVAAAPVMDNELGKAEEESDEAVESIREEEVVRPRRSSFSEVEANDADRGTDSDDDGDASSSIGTGMGSRKDSAESGITSTGAFDFGDELAGLGLTSLAPSSIHESSRASRWVSKRSMLTNGKGIDTTLLGPRSSRMELQTSQSSSSPEFANSVITPSTTQSDAFEFGSLAGSPDTASWAEQRDEREEDEDDQDEPFPRDLGVSRSPAMKNLSTEHDGGNKMVEVSGDPVQEPLEDVEDEEPGEVDDEVSELAPVQQTGTTTQGTTTSLGAAVQLGDGETPLRVPRNMARRDPASTTSMLIRDVRNQATLATFALKKTPASPPTRALTKKSIRKISISSPHLVSAPADMATVPIVPSPNLSADSFPASRSPRAGNKMPRSKSRKDLGDADLSKSRGLGSRFKMLLKKQSRDHLSLNGDEVTPFVDRPSTEVARAPEGPPPVTPPNQHAAQFSSTPGSGPASDLTSTPTGDPTTPLARPHPVSAVRSPPRRPPPPSLDVVEELAERASPPRPAEPDNIKVSAIPPSPVLSHLSGSQRGLNRFVSRLRKSPVSLTSQHQDSDYRDLAQTPSSKTSLDGSEPRTSNADAGPAAFGLGIDNNGGRTSYESQESPTADQDARFTSTMADTAPLSVGRNSQASFALQQGFSFPAESSTPVVSRRSQGSSRVSRTSGHPVRASTDSMQRLWEAAEDLGLPPDKVQELVDSAYAQSPTTSHGHSGSVSSSFGNRSSSAYSPRRQRSNASHSRRGGSASSHTRHTSEASSAAAGHHRRKSSTASSRSLQDRVPTPPPGSRHHRKASLASSREAGPVPERPTSSYLPPSSSTGSRLSVAGSTYPPPASPSLGSIMSSRQSGYADSFLDFYAQASDDYESDIPPVPPLSQQHASDRSLAAQSDGFKDRTLHAEHDQDDEGQDEVGGEVVWQVLSDLRNNRLSTISKDSSFGFDSRDSSFEVDHGASDGPSTSNDRSESIANMLRHRDRKRSSASMPPFQAGRFPSIYVRDEQKLLDLGQHGGVATEQQGHFFVRPKNTDDTSHAPPPLPDEYRQLIASASSRSPPRDARS